MATVPTVAFASPKTYTPTNSVCSFTPSLPSFSATSQALPKTPTPRFDKIRSAKREDKAPTATRSDAREGVSLYKPKSYEVLVTDAANSLAFALRDGKTRFEIDFPPLPSNISSYKGSSDEFIDANIQLALAVVKKLQQKMETRACIVFPDKPERRRASQLFKAALDSIDGITIGSLDDVPGGAVTSFFISLRNTLDFDFEDENEGR